MIHFWNTLNIQITGDTAVTLGKFDGLHRGHQKLLDDIKRTVFMIGTFYPMRMFS